MQATSMDRKTAVFVAVVSILVALQPAHAADKAVNNADLVRLENAARARDLQAASEAWAKTFFGVKSHQRFIKDPDWKVAMTTSPNSNEGAQKGDCTFLPCHIHFQYGLETMHAAIVILTLFKSMRCLINFATAAPPAATGNSFKLQRVHCF
jgi:hypothetical protein